MSSVMCDEKNPWFQHVLWIRVLIPSMPFLTQKNILKKIIELNAREVPADTWTKILLTKAKKLITIKSPLMLGSFPKTSSTKDKHSFLCSAWMAFFRIEKDSRSWFDWIESPKKDRCMNNRFLPGNNWTHEIWITSWQWLLLEIFSNCSAARTGGLDTDMYLTLLAARCADKLCAKFITLWYMN